MTKFNDFYNQKPQTNGICIPDLAIFLANDRKLGKWKIGDNLYDDISFYAIKIEQKITEYLGEKQLSGCLWMVAHDCEITPGIAMYTLIRKAPLKSFSAACMMLPPAPGENRQLDYREVIWTPRFTPKSALLPNEKGIPELAQWFDISWKFRLPKSEKDWEVYEQVLAVAESPEMSAELIDWDLEARSLPASSMTRQEIAEALGLSKEKAQLPPAAE